MVPAARKRMVVAALALVLAIAGSAGSAAASKVSHGAKRADRLTITVLSGRADLISGGGALVAISGARSTRGLTVTVAGARPTSALPPRAPRGAVGPGRPFSP